MEPLIILENLWNHCSRYWNSSLKLHFYTKKCLATLPGSSDVLGKLIQSFCFRLKDSVSAYLPFAALIKN